MRLEQEGLAEPGLVKALEEATYSVSEGHSANPHSSEFYRAIQFTCRQLIKLKNPMYSDLKELKNQTRAGSLNNENVLKLIERIDMKYIQREVRFFYPYEVQVVDQKSFEENEKGRSAHSEYKRAQLQTALKRVMGVLADVGRQ